MKNGKLAWNELKGKTVIELAKKVPSLKENFSIEDLCKGLSREFMIFIEYVKNSKFEEDPNYNYLKNLFIEVIKKVNIKNDLLLPWISPKDRKIAIDSSKRFTLNSLTIKKHSPIKKILKNLKKSRVTSESKSKIFTGNNKKNTFYNKIININIIIDKKDMIHNFTKIIPKENINKYIGKLNTIKDGTGVEQKLHPQCSLDILNNKQTVIAKSFYLKTKSDNKNYFKTNAKNIKFNMESTPDKKMDNDKICVILNNDIDYIPKTNATKLIFNKFKYSTLNTLNETKTNRKINPISRNSK